MKIRCHIDGSYNYQTKQIGFGGYVQQQFTSKILYKFTGYYMPNTQNDAFFAEMLSLYHLLTWLCNNSHQESKIIIYSDCLNLVNHIKNNLPILTTSAHKDLFLKIKGAMYELKELDLIWQERAKNKIADKLSRKNIPR